MFKNTVKKQNAVKKYCLKRYVYAALSLLFAAATLAFFVMFIRRGDYPFVIKYGTALEFGTGTVVLVLGLVTAAFSLFGSEFLYKTGFVCLVFVFICSGGLYILSVTGFLSKIDSVEALREYIASYGALSAIYFFVLQILQVVILPIPGVIAIGAGVLLFGPFLGATLSLAGILAGSFMAFFIGRRFGYKAVSWLVGRENLDKTLELVKGKDKLVLSFMFFFPFFPDDVLCFVSGLSSMSFKFFGIMIFSARLISTYATAYSVNGSLIPYNTWWGILIWAILIAGTFFLVKFVYSNGERIEKFFKKIKK